MLVKNFKNFKKTAQIHEQILTRPISTIFIYVCMYVCMYACMYVCMYEVRDHQDPVKGSGWVLFPSTMAEQPIQQMVVGHLCLQERAEQ